MSHLLCEGHAVLTHSYFAVQEMESHEEKLSIMIEQSKINEAKEEGKRKAQMIREQQREAARLSKMGVGAGGMSGMGGGSFGGVGGSGANSPLVSAALSTLCVFGLTACSMFLPR